MLFNFVVDEGVLTPDGRNVTLKDVLVFFSGADAIPPLGFPREPSLVFIHNSLPLPTASTCALELRIPTVHTEYSTFKDAMITGVMGHGGFRKN